MAGSQEIRTQIKSIQNTQKITKAMEMVAASKMRKAISQMEMARPYADKISEVMTHLANAHPEYDSAFFEIRTIKKRAYIVVSSDRGLCGGLNNNLFKNMIQQSIDNKNNEIESSYSVIGNKAASFFQRIGGEVISQSTHLGDKPQIEDLLGTIKSTIDKFLSKDVDEVYIAYNKFVNTVSQIPTIEKILPIQLVDSEEKQVESDILIEPDIDSFVEEVLPKFFNLTISSVLLESITSEHAARTAAMDNATRNADDILRDTTILFNKTRQAYITTELMDIVNGAEAIK